jgi:hypothetical protein
VGGHRHVADSRIAGDRYGHRVHHLSQDAPMDIEKAERVRVSLLHAAQSISDAHGAQVTLVSITWREAPGTFPGDKRRVVEEVKFIYQSTGERK